MSDRLLKSSSHKSRRIRHVYGVIANNGTATITRGQDFTISRSGVGVVAVTLSRPGRSLLYAQCNVMNATAATGHSAKTALSAANQGATTVTFSSFVADAADGAPADVDFSFQIVVQDA